MRLLKTIGGAGALVGAALIGGTLISAALAAPAADESTTTSDVAVTIGDVREEYLETFLDTLATELGVDRSALGPAALAAANAAIDARVAAGDIAEDVAADIKERLADLENPEALLAGRGFLAHGPGGPGRGIGHAFGLGLAEAADAAAEALGLERSALIEALRDAGSLEQVASDEGVAYDTVKAAVLDAVETRLADEVADEDLTQDRADRILANVTDWLDDGGEVRRGMFGGPRGPRF